MLPSILPFLKASSIEFAFSILSFFKGASTYLSKAEAANIVLDNIIVETTKLNFFINTPLINNLNDTCYHYF